MVDLTDYTIFINALNVVEQKNAEKTVGDMNLKQLYDIIERQMILCEQRHQDPAEIRVCIPIQTAKAIGGTPCANVKQANKGFD